MADDQILKAEKDYTKDVENIIPEAEELAKVCFLRAVIIDGKDLSC